MRERIKALEQELWEEKTDNSLLRDREKRAREDLRKCAYEFGQSENQVDYLKSELNKKEILLGLANNEITVLTRIMKDWNTRIMKDWK